MKNNLLIKFIQTLILLVISSSIFAQNVGIGTMTPDPSAKLDISSINSGLLTPRMTTAQRTAIASPATGLLVFDNTTNSFWFYNGSAWTNLATINTDNQDLTLLGNTLSLTNDGTPVNLSTYLDNTDNQRTDVFQLSGNNLQLSLQNDGIATQNVNLSSFLDNTDNQDLNLAGNILSLTNDATSVNLSAYLDNTDNQNLSLAGKTLSISNGNNVLLPNESKLIDNDGDTKVDVEETADEDIIRFDIAGNEKWAMIGNRINHIGKNLLIGQDAGLNISTGENNIALGYHALRSGLVNNNSIAIGHAAMSTNFNGNFSVSIGTNALVANGAASVAIGAYAGENGGNNSVYLGHAAGRTYSPDGAVFIGRHAGYNENHHNKLYIENSQSSSPLIYGEFDNDILRVNGAFQINDPTGTGFTFPMVDGTANQVLQTNGAGQLAWTAPSSDAQTLSIVGNTLSILNGNNVVLPSESALIDADGDTKVDVESTPDEDLIRLELGGTEYFRVEAGRIQTFNSNGSIFIGQGAGENAFPAGAYANTFVGNRAGNANTAACCNTGFGWGTLERTTARGNTAVGSAALWSNTIGVDNVALGWAALQDNTTASFNVAVGQSTLRHNTTGIQNAAVGYRSLYFNTTGGGNAAVGVRALYSNTTGSSNVAVGGVANYSNTTGSYNTALGYGALQNNSTGSSNTAIGRYAGFNALGGGNVFLGYHAGENETGADKLYIDNSNTANPLIHGDFATNRLTFNGNVGVNRAATAAYNLDVNATARVGAAQIGNWPASNAYAMFGHQAFAHTAASITFGEYALLQQNNGTTYLNSHNNSLYLRTNNADRLTITQGGNIGIGTTNPTRARLEINGSAISAIPAVRYFTLGVALSYYGGGGTNPYSIWATDHIAAAQFEAFSDARIKSIQGISNSHKDLATLLQLEITDYTMIDTIAKGSKVSKKVIAQQVNKIYPQAVNNNSTRAIPDIYQPSTINEGWVPCDQGLTVGEQIKLLTMEGEGIYEVIAVKNSSFKVNLDYTGEIFIYGRQVNDFHTVDYEAISMLNVSATQELAKQLAITKNENKALKFQLATLQNQVSQIQAHLGINNQSSK